MPFDRGTDKSMESGRCLKELSHRRGKWEKQPSRPNGKLEVGGGGSSAVVKKEAGLGWRLMDVNRIWAGTFCVQFTIEKVRECILWQPH